MCVQYRHIGRQDKNIHTMKNNYLKKTFLCRIPVGQEIESTTDKQERVELKSCTAQETMD